LDLCFFFYLNNYLVNYYFSSHMAVFCGFLLGLGDSGFTTQIYNIIGVKYSNNSASATSLFMFMQVIYYNRQYKRFLFFVIFFLLCNHDCFAGNVSSLKLLLQQSVWNLHTNNYIGNCNDHWHLIVSYSRQMYYRLIVYYKNKNDIFKLTTLYSRMSYYYKILNDCLYFIIN